MSLYYIPVSFTINLSIYNDDGGYREQSVGQAHNTQLVKSIKNNFVSYAMTLLTESWSLCKMKDEI